MKARTINKRDLDELIRLERKFYRTGDADILSARSVVCDDIAHATDDRIICDFRYSSAASCKQTDCDRKRQCGNLCGVRTARLARGR